MKKGGEEAKARKEDRGKEGKKRREGENKERERGREGRRERKRVKKLLSNVIWQVQIFPTSSPSYLLWLEF